MTTELTIANVVSAYSGRNGKCCCGCSGTHYTAAENPAQVTRILNKITNTRTPENVEELSNCVCLVVGRRLYIAYLA